VTELPNRSALVANLEACLAGGCRLDTIKIDRSFIEDMSTDAAAAGIVRGTSNWRTALV
jgi:EAL domain-containing protein (putative c-di-GMP-specific phosphodiesterase class I)